MNKWMIWGGNPTIFGNTQIFPLCVSTRLGHHISTEIASLEQCLHLGNNLRGFAVWKEDFLELRANRLTLGTFGRRLDIILSDFLDVSKQTWFCKDGFLFDV